MRTVRFIFTGDTRDVRPLAEDIIRAVAARALDVELLPLLEGAEVIGLLLSGEHELVSMACEQMRKALQARGVRFREEHTSRPEEGDTTARAILESIVTRKPSPPQSPSVDADKDEDEEDEYEEYDLEELSRAEYGQYPLSIPQGSLASRRAQEQDETLRAAREQRLPDQPDGLATSPTLSVEERRRLSFVRAFKSGKSFYRMGMHDDAERNLQAALKLNRSDPELHFYLALVSDNLGRPEQSERHFRRAIALDPDVGANHFYLGNLLQKQGRLDRAVVEYKRAIERDPDVAIIYNNLAWVFYQQSDHERALRTFETSISMDPDLPFAHNGIACVYQEIGAFPDAVAAFRKAIELYPDYAAAHLKLGWCLLQLGEIDAAIQAFKAVLDVADDGEYASSANYSLGHSYMAQDRLLDAQEAFRKVVAEDDDDFVDALLHLGIIQVRLGFGESGVSLLRRYLRKAGEAASDEAWKYLANAFFQASQYGSAVRACRRALQHDGDDGEVYELMGQIAAAQKKRVAAERHLRHAIELAPESATAWFHLGEVLESRKASAQAAQAYRRAILLDGESPDAYNALGRLYGEEGRRDEALVLCEKALELAPTHTAALGNLGWLHAQMGAYENALACYSKALHLEPDNVRVRCSAGALYLQMGRREDADRELRRVLASEADARTTAQAHFFLGLLSRLRQAPSRAVEHLEEAVRLDSELGPAWFRLGEMCLEQGHLPFARRALERYLDLEPQGEFAGAARQYVLERLAGVALPRAGSLLTRLREAKSAPAPASPRRKKRTTARPQVRRTP